MHAKVLVTIAVTLLPNAGWAQSLDWTRYRLADGSAGIDLPFQLFSVDGGSSRRGSGHSFSTPDGRANVSLYTIANQPQRSPSEFLDQEFQLPRSSAIYRRVTGNMLAISGYRGDQIYYARCNFGRERLHCVALNYPADEKRRWDAIVTRVSRSLSRAG